MLSTKYIRYVSIWRLDIPPQFRGLSTLTTSALQGQLIYIGAPAFILYFIVPKVWEKVVKEAPTPYCGSSHAQYAGATMWSYKFSRETLKMMDRIYWIKKWT